MAKINVAQGEVRITSIDAIPSCAKTVDFTEKNEKGFIISHSEQGNHHILAGLTNSVVERTNDVPAGCRILYAEVKEDTKLFQDATRAHDVQMLPKGLYEIRTDREYDPFSAQARRVAD